MNPFRFILPALMCLLLCGCYGFKHASAWKDRDLTIDGKDTEWQDAMTGSGGIYLGVRNDADFLYLCVSSTNKMAKAQMMGLFKQDFTVWFSPRGKARGSLGIRFSNESPFMDETLVSKVKFMKTQAFQVLADEMMNHLVVEVVRNGYPVALLPEAKGMDVATGMSMGGRKLTYELKVPLTQNEGCPFAVGAAPGETIEVGVETSGIDMDLVSGRMERLPTDSGYRIRARESAMGRLDPEFEGRVALRGKITLAREGK